MPAEAAEATLKWIEETMAPLQTVCLIHADNRRSLRVAEKLGFVLIRSLTYRNYPARLFRRPSGVDA